MQRAEIVPFAWGLADAYVSGRYIISAIGRGTVPFFGDLTEAHETAGRLDLDQMMWLSSAGAMLMASLIISSILLLSRKRAGAILSYVQAPFRVLMVLPSIPFLPLILPLFVDLGFDVAGLPADIAAGFILVAILELVRVLTLIWWRRREPAV